MCRSLFAFGFLAAANVAVITAAHIAVKLGRPSDMYTLSMAVKAWDKKHEKERVENLMASIGSLMKGK